MNIKKMQHVLTLAEHLNFSRACAEVHLSQPALSRSIQSIEAELGVNLFDRSGSRVALTACGKVFVERAKRIVFEANELLRDIALSQKEDGTGELSVGLGPTGAALLVRPILSHFTSAMPGVFVNIKHGDADSLLNMLLAERVDLFVGDVTRLAFRQEVSVIPLPDFVGGFFCRPDHPVLEHESVTPATLLTYPLGCTFPTPYAVDYLNSYFNEPFEPHLKLLSDDFAEMASAALRSNLILLGSDPVFNDQLGAGALRRISLAMPLTSSPKLGIVHLRGRTVSKPVAKVIEIAKSTFHSYVEGA
jgi:DNA-binding transcriptional LysR family regulator